MNKILSYEDDCDEAGTPFDETKIYIYVALTFPILKRVLYSITCMQLYPICHINGIFLQLLLLSYLIPGNNIALL